MASGPEPILISTSGCGCPGTCSRLLTPANAAVRASLLPRYSGAPCQRPGRAWLLAPGSWPLTRG
jgi:hypothetical protein